MVSIRVCHTGLGDSLSQALSKSMVDHARLFNMLMNHATQIQQSEDSNQHILEPVLPPSKLPLDIKKEEGRSWCSQQMLPKVDISGWGITCTEFHPCKRKQSDETSDFNRQVKTQRAMKPKRLMKFMGKSLPAQCQVCFKCRECDHTLHECLSRTWNDPKDWDIVSPQGERIELSREFIWARELLQHLTTPRIPFPSHQSSHLYCYEESSDLVGCYNCFEMGHFAHGCPNPEESINHTVART
jgi:hypothetical protein